MLGLTGRKVRGAGGTAAVRLASRDWQGHDWAKRRGAELLRGLKSEGDRGRGGGGHGGKSCCWWLAMDRWMSSVGHRQPSLNHLRHLPHHYGTPVATGAPGGHGSTSWKDVAFMPRPRAPARARAQLRVRLEPPCRAAAAAAGRLSSHHGLLRVGPWPARARASASAFRKTPEHACVSHRTLAMPGGRLSKWGGNWQQATGHSTGSKRDGRLVRRPSLDHTIPAERACVI